MLRNHTKRAFQFISASMLGSPRELGLSFVGQLRMLLVTGTHSVAPVEPSPMPVSPPLLAVSQNARELWKQRQPRMEVTSRALSSLLWAPMGSTPLVGVWEPSLKPDVSEQAESCNLTLAAPPSLLRGWSSFQFPCLGYLVPQIPHAENPHTDCKSVSKNFALTCIIMQLHSAYTQEFCSGINYNTTTVIRSKSGLQSVMPFCWVKPRDSNSAFTQQSLRSKAGRNSPVHATFLYKSLETVESGLKSGFQDLTQFNLGIVAQLQFFTFFVRLNN